MEKSSLDYSTIIVKVLFFILTAAFVLFVAYGIYLLIIPFAISFLLTLLLSPLINYLERYNVSRVLSVILILPLTAGLLGGIFWLAFPAISAEFNAIEGRMEFYMSQVKTVLGDLLWWLNDKLSAYFRLTKTDLPSLMQEIIRPLEEGVKGMGKGLVASLPNMVTYLLITPIITFVFLIQGNVIYHNLLGMVPNRYFEMSLLLVKKIKEAITSYLKGLFYQWIILVAIMAPGLYFIGLPYGPVVGILAASVNIVPYLGPLIGLVPALLLAVIAPGEHMVGLTLAVIGFAQLVDNMFTQPVVLARSVQVHPVISILAVVTAISLESMMLVVVAIPIAGILMLSIDVMYRSLKAFRMI